MRGFRGACFGSSVQNCRLCFRFICAGNPEVRKEDASASLDRADYAFDVTQNFHGSALASDVL
jgi:hypothetical protein